MDTPDVVGMPDDELLDHLQRAAFGYFADQANPTNGLVGDTSRADSPASIAVVGLALSVYPVAVERGWLTRADAAARTLVTLQFFANKPAGPGRGRDRSTKGSTTTSWIARAGGASGNARCRRSTRRS